MPHNIEIAKGARKTATPFARIEDAVEAFRGGKMIIVVDDEDRENEGDLTIAADNAKFGQTGPRVGSFDGGFGCGLLARRSRRGAQA